MPRRFIRKNNWEFGGPPAPEEGESGEPKSRKRRLATTLVFTTLFFAGASLAAVAGNQFTPLSGGDAQRVAVDTTATTTTDAEATPAAVDDASAVAAPADAGAVSADPSSDAAAPATAGAPVSTDESVDQLAADPTPPPNPTAASTADAAAAPAGTSAAKPSARVPA